MPAAPSSFSAGQRWLSETQPELGLALILKADATTVQAHFPASGESFTFATRTAPLRRVAFEPGDNIRDEAGANFLVSGTREEEGCIIYLSESGGELHESALSDTISFQKPEARLMAGLVDPPHLWRLRQNALRHQHANREREIRGLIGGRVSLIPHQLYIAHEVSGRFAPRVLLADEVGLGKTIEACLILHRLHLSGRAQRILILVPDALVHQWFVELYRRFAMTFSIYDEERARSIEAEMDDDAVDKALNPFFDDQLVLCPTSWVASNSKRAEQIASAEWDLAIVDEAHHLEWTPEQPSPAYRTVAEIARNTPGLLLLTATPEQLGREGHFARLQLLDPDRFSDLEEFITESEHFGEISQLADQLRSGETLKADSLKLLDQLLGEGTSADAAFETKDQEFRDVLVDRLVDLHGTGRVMFRNRRTVLEGFPTRLPHLHALDNPDEQAATEVKLRWVSKVIKSAPGEKHLLICHSKETAIEIEESLAAILSTSATAVFHEDLSLLQRDRNAAWFADEDGASVLICSEIGSEGRNFQFAHHLVLFDLPADPGLLEQRIGRLDRIGQESDIHIHVPYLIGTTEELWAMWYHKGLNAFAKTLHGSREVLRRFGDELAAMEKAASIGTSDWEVGLPDLIDRTKAAKIEIDADLESGRDHLLEISSHRPKEGEELTVAIEELDEDWQLQKYFLRLLDHFGVTVEDLGESEFLLKPENLFDASVFPGLPDQGISITFDREIALHREELTFLTWDHPMVTSAMESLLASERGNCAFSRMDSAPEQALLMELVVVVECVAPKRIHAERFLPPTPLVALVDHHGKDRSKDFAGAELLQRAKEGELGWLRKNGKNLRAVVPGMMEAATARGEKFAEKVRTEALAVMEERMDAEIARLEQLRGLGHPIRDAELKLARSEREALTKALTNARLRTDSVRLILATP